MSHLLLLAFGLLGVSLFMLVGLSGDSSPGGRRFFHILAIVFVLPFLLLLLMRILRRRSTG